MLTATTAAYSAVTRNAVKNNVKKAVRIILIVTGVFSADDAIRITSAEARDISEVSLETSSEARDVSSSSKVPEVSTRLNVSGILSGTPLVRGLSVSFD